MCPTDDVDKFCNGKVQRQAQAATLSVEASLTTVQPHSGPSTSASEEVAEGTILKIGELS